VREQVKPEIGVGAVGGGQAEVSDDDQLGADPHPANLIRLLLHCVRFRANRVVRRS
jgi:hypothetical protein